MASGIEEPGRDRVRVSRAKCQAEGCEWSQEVERGSDGTVSAGFRVVVAGHLMMCHAFMPDRAQKIALMVK